MMNAQGHFLGTYQLPWFYFSDVEIYFKITRSKIELSCNFMENSDEQKSALTNQYIDAKVNVGNKGVLDAFKVRSRVALEKETAAARAMLLKNRASTSLAGHGFISSIQPCILATTKTLPISNATPFANCRKHGFASYLALEEIEKSEYYTRVEIRYPEHQIIHKYMDCELKFHEQTSRHTNMLQRAQWGYPQTRKGEGKVPVLHWQ
ncbi:hypothetical protein FXO38_25763 [Capsicum annuum]|uniref:uncharacterized protein LOC107865824 n=1 Tax=Capsicum annuum TaxID=4072 RepID=UPI0007BFE62C|nr:uncharacterized protein LOC107865824 [Capsicum annuum]KAF3633101.1 hypothetical protein FXO38_25763 [Capsicum annuum]KAF3635320.1 hypothetical protein FXO37_26047 [Capsicum annuum]